jgi:hypothetical protein
MRCSDENYYVVKFQNNPHGERILANELLATSLARWLGLPTAEPAVVYVHPDLVRYTEELIIRVGVAGGRQKCRPGLCFGSRASMAAPHFVTPYDFLPGELFACVQNSADFIGMLVFDKWTANMDNRQAIFVRDDYLAPTASLYRTYRVIMIDNEYCFNGDRWNFPDAAKWGLYPRPVVYTNVQGMETMEPHLQRLEGITMDVLEGLASEIPPEWYAHNEEALHRLLAELYRRRRIVRDLLYQTRKAFPALFPAWSLPGGLSVAAD